MATKPLIHAGPDSQTRETSPFFSLPNEDGSNPHQEYDSDQSHQYPPITLSCVGCERIVGDSSAFLCATRQMATITLDRMVSVTIGSEGLKTSLEGEWDEFCNYKDITCGKCAVALGKMYFATTSKLSALQNKYTLDITALSFYHHASHMPSLPIAATSEIYAQLHPSPEALAENIDHIMTICVMLRDDQGDIVRELKKLGQATGVDIDLEDGGTSGEGLDIKESWKERVEALDEIVEKVKVLEEKIGEMGKRLGKEDGSEYKIATVYEERDSLAEETEFLLKENKGPRKKTQQDDIVMSEVVSLPSPPGPRRQEKEKAFPPVVNKRKRKSGVEGATTSGAGKQLLYIDLSSAPEQDDEPPAPPPVQLEYKRKSKKEIPNSQSVDEAEKEDNISNGEDEYQVEKEHVQEEEEEEIEDRIKSPAEKRRKAVVPVVYRKEIAGRRVSQGRRVHK